MTNPAATDDLAGRFFRPLTEREQEIAPQWLDDAYTLLLARRPTLEADVDTGRVNESSVIRVVCAMVARVFSNPEGKTREAVDDYSYDRSAAVADGSLYVAADELADLTPGRVTNRSIRLVNYGDV